MDLVGAFYVASAGFPKDEVFGLQAQVRRAAVSVPANVAEGAARKTTAELIQFLYVANGSLSELIPIRRLLGSLAMWMTAQNSRPT